MTVSSTATRRGGSPAFWRRTVKDRQRQLEILQERGRPESAWRHCLTALPAWSENQLVHDLPNLLGRILALDPDRVAAAGKRHGAMLFVDNSGGLSKDLQIKVRPDRKDTS